MMGTLRRVLSVIKKGVDPQYPAIRDRLLEMQRTVRIVELRAARTRKDPP